MRMTNVSVKKLFGIFDHEIPMQSSRITIIHGPNGFGKTVLLRMIHGLFNSKYKVFSEIPFQEFRVMFDNGNSIYVQRLPLTSQLSLEHMFGEESNDISVANSAKFIIGYGSGTDAASQTYEPKLSREQGRKFLHMIESISELDQIGSNRWLNLNTGSIMSTEDVIETYDLQSKLYSEGEPRWFTDIKEQIHTRFIQAQRLQSTIPSSRFRSYFRRREGPPVPSAAVERYSQEIAKTIQDKLTEYGVLSQARDRSFPIRLIESGDSHEFDQDQLQGKLRELESKSSKLMELGLLDKDEDAPDIPNLGSGQENLNNALSIYVQDIDEKLAVFDEVSEQLRILTDIINERFKFKTLAVNKNDGFILHAQDGSQIPPANLSSGEQHELVLFYQLLFYVDPNSLILIDEPELSLHVTWQRNFLSDIQRITELREFDVLLATHSPQIIGDKYDWMVDLQNPEAELADDVVEYA